MISEVRELFKFIKKMEISLNKESSWGGVTTGIHYLTQSITGDEVIS